MAVGTPPSARAASGCGARQHDDVGHVGHLEVLDPFERGDPVALGQQRLDDPGGRDAVEAQQPYRVDPVLGAPLDPGPLDGGDGVDERAVEVEQDPREGRVEGAPEGTVDDVVDVTGMPNSLGSLGDSLGHPNGPHRRPSQGRP